MPAPPLASSSGPPVVTLAVGEYGVWPIGQLNLRVTGVRDGAVAMSALHLTHVVAGHFASPLNLADNAADMLAAADRASPGSAFHLRIVYRGPDPGRRGGQDRQPTEMAQMLRAACISTARRIQLVPAYTLPLPGATFRVLHVHDKIDIEPEPLASPPAGRTPAPRAGRMRNITP
jgi:hypothetical protein